MKENQQIEWKESWRDEYLRWICGFANAEGGVLHIGRNDQGVVVGVPNAARLLEDIPNKVRDILGVVVEVKLHEEAGKEWLEIVVEPYRGIQRVGALPVPEAALREAVLNAIIHKNYASGAPIQIRVYGDRLKIWNAGELPGNWSVANLLGEHSSRPFNPSVANAFFRAGAIEAWGRGVQRILDACQEAGAPAPAIRYQPGDLWVEFAFPAEYLAVIPTNLSEGEWGEKWGEKWGASLTAKRRKIVETMRRNARVTIPELAADLGLGTSAIENHLKALRVAGCVRRIGPAKGGHWEVLS